VFKYQQLFSGHFSPHALISNSRPLAAYVAYAYLIHSPIPLLGPFYTQEAPHIQSHNLPITPLSQQLSQLIQCQRILLIKSTQHRTINIQHRDNLPINQERHNNLALRRAVAGDVVRERLNVVDDLDGLVGGCVAADAASECNGLAGDLAMEGPEDELGRGGLVEDVEACEGC
jgi:hypothetical protein